MNSDDEPPARPVGSREVFSAWAIFAFLLGALVLAEIFDTAIVEVIEIIVQLR